MKKKSSSKRCIALILAVVMIVTSVPFMMVGAVTTGAYDPAPYWGDGDSNAAANTSFVATLNVDGSIKVSFPHANPAATWNTYTATNPTKKTITNYIFEITRMDDNGNHEPIWTENIDVSKPTTPAGGTFTVDNTEGNSLPNSIYYWPGAFTGLEGYKIESSYDISIQAVDSDGWVSDKIHTLLTETPYYIINDDFSPNESWVVREMLLFEQKGNAKVDETDQSNGGASGADYSVHQGNDLIDVNGQMSGVGYNGGAGYRLWIKNAYSGTPYIMTSTWSRSHYDFSNAEEVWFYVDLSRVQINKIAFTLSANEKYFEHKKAEDNTIDDIEHSKYGDIFSTKAVNGVNTGIKDGVYLQNADGLWEEVRMTDGYLTNLSGYKGFIRIPIDYFVLQSDQYITADNNLAGWSGTSNEGNLEDYVNNHWFASNSTLTVPNSDGSTRTITSEYLSAEQLDACGVSGFWYERGDYSVAGANAFKVNPAGTSIKDAHIINQRVERTTNWMQQIFKRGMGDCLSRHATVSVSGTSYTVTKPYFAIQDMLSAGVEVAEWSAESVHKSFYIDQVMFCQRNTGGTFDSEGYVTDASSIKFPQEGSTVNSSGTADLGRKMAGFYDRTVQVPSAVSQYIMQYFGEIPSLNDFGAKDMIDDIIINYIDCFGINNSSVLSDEEKVEQAIEKLNTLGHTEAYNRYKVVEQFYSFVYSGDASSNYNAVVYFENEIEKLPKGEFLDHTDKELQSTLKQLMAIYETFNLSHHELLGADAEARFLELYDFIVGEEVKTGQSIGAYPFIPFNDFETNYSYGQLSDMYYDDYPAYESSKPTDINSTGNFTTYVSSKVIDQPGEIGGTAIGWSPADFRPSGETIDSSSGTYFSRMDAQITNNGFNDSLGATINLKGNLVCDPENKDWKIATLSTTYLGAEADTWGNLPGLDLSGIAVKTNASQGTEQEVIDRYGEGVIPNSFVMYVDFSEVSNLNFNVKFILSDAEGNDVNCYFCGGKEGEFPVIYLLDENGDWEVQRLAVTQTDIKAASTLYREVEPGICTIAPSEHNTLEGYKGFIRIPLTCFRFPTYGGVANANVNFEYLDNALDKYKIKQAKISVWDESNNNEGKKIIIDGLGFTYDPKCTTRVSNSTDCNGELNQDNGIFIKNMDAYFGVKTVDSSNFEKMVSTIDPYASEAEFMASFEACIAAYTALSEYQQSITEIKFCKESLLEKKYRALYTDYTNEVQKEQWKPYYTTTADATAIQQLQTDVAGISTVAKTYSVNSESIHDLYKEHKENYLEQLGFVNIEEAAHVVTIYEKGLYRLSITDRNVFMYKDGMTFESGYTDEYIALYNAYNAANRAILIGGDADVHEGVEKDGIIANVETFKANITNIYGLSTHFDEDADRIIDTEDDNNGDGVVDTKDLLRMVSYKSETTDENGNAVKALKYYTDMYVDISVFGKMLLSDDTNTAAAYKNMYDAAEAIYDNSTPIVPNAGETVFGGIVTYEKRLEDAYADVSSKIAAKTVLDKTTLNEVEYCLGQYEAFLRRYALVDELNYNYAELALLLPTADLTTSDSIVLTNADDNPLYMDVANAELNYVASRLGKNVSVYLVTDYKWTQTTGSTYDFGYFTVNSTTGTDGTMLYTKLGDYANGEIAEINPVISVDETASKKVPTGAQYSGKIKIVAFDSSTITDGVDFTSLIPVATVEIPVVFSSTNGADPMVYEVQIPAKVDIDWDTTNAVDVSYSVEATLGSNELSVSVSNDGTDMLINDDTGTIYELSYSKANFGTETFTGDVVGGTRPTNTPSITVTGWDSVPVGTYSTQLTYIVDVTS